MTFKLIVLLGCLLLALNSAFAQPPVQPKIVGSPDIIIDRNTGQGQVLITLRNSNETKLENLSLTGVVTTAGGIKPSITFKAAASSQTNPSSEKSSVEEGESIYEIAAIEPKRTVNVVVVATKVSEDGEFDLELRNNDDVFGKLKIIRPPFAVTLDGPNPNEADLAIRNLAPITLTLKNNDQVSYPVQWILSVNGQEFCRDKVTLAAKGTGIIQCKPEVPLSIQELFKVRSAPGSLLLYPDKEGGFDQSAPWKTIPAKTSLSYFDPTTQQVLGYFAIVAILVAGGLTSLVLSQSLPNRLKRLNIRDRLQNVGVSTSNLSSKIGSGLQVLLRLERNRLFDLLESRNTFSPDFAGIAARSNEDTDKLEARVALAQRIDIVLGRLDQKITLGPPPSQVADIEALIDDAKVILMKTQLTPRDLEAALTIVTDAENKVDKVNQEDPTFGEALAKRALEVQQDTTCANSPTFVRIMKALPRANAALQAVPAGTTTIAPANYAAVDTSVEKMLLIKDYALLMDGTLDPEILARLQAREDKLLELLQLQSCAAMRGARLLLRQMKGDVYPERIQEKLIAGAATIVVEPIVAYDKAPLQFCVSFHSEEIDEAAAKEQWQCEWDFGDGLMGRGWSASHYFLLQRPGRFRSRVPTHYTVKATFRDGNGTALLDPTTNKPLTIEKIVTVRPTRRERFFGDRARTELVKLLAALLIAVFALVSGAREQLLKLDILPGLIAVFMVGFGADTIKNLLTKSEST